MGIPDGRSVQDHVLEGSQIATARTTTQQLKQKEYYYRSGKVYSLRGTGSNVGTTLALCQGSS